MASWESIGLFATPLVKMNVEQFKSVNDTFHAEIKQREADIQKNREDQRDASLLDHYGNYTNVFSEYPSLIWLRDLIEEYGTFAYQELLNYRKSGNLKMVNAWFNLAQRGASQAKHSHANSLLSGTLYLNTDQDTSITFYHPLTNGSLHHELFDQAVQSENAHGLRYHYSQVEISVTAGDCLFWPSHLYHGYTNNCTEDRLSLSFNLMPSRLNSVYQITPI